MNNALLTPQNHIEISYSKVMKGLILAHEKKEILTNKRRRVTSHLNVLSDHGNSSITSKGWRRLTTIRKALDSFKPFNSK
tara:strand:- start:529 stop:768 length:240 start_codon:yes stop_codon:yes gene_type:complete